MLFLFLGLCPFVWFWWSVSQIQSSGASFLPRRRRLRPRLRLPAHRELRVEAVIICWGKWYGSCVPILLTMGDEPDSYVRYQLGATLGNCGDPQAIPVLLKLLHESDTAIESSAAQEMGKFKRFDGVPVMINLVRNPPSSKSIGVGNVTMVLKELTGQDFEENRGAWRDWWEATGRAQYGDKP
jgi:hypothetical protein